MVSGRSASNVPSST
ncbi:hypothetical protein ID866_10941 [Astraeus odoratus]|nr:hypothetical protein ID866_10941 [Astraeus odoratus]